MKISSSCSLIYPLERMDSIKGFFQCWKSLCSFGFLGDEDETMIVLWKLFLFTEKFHFWLKKFLCEWSHHEHPHYILMNFDLQSLGWKVFLYYDKFTFTSWCKTHQRHWSYLLCLFLIFLSPFNILSLLTFNVLWNWKMI